MVHELVRVHTGARPYDDRDDYINKRIDAAGWLMSLQLRQLFRPYLKTVRASLQRTMDTGRALNVSAAIHPKKISAGIRIAMCTGVWGTSGANRAKGGGQQVGVVQALTRMSIPAIVSHLRRVNTPVNKESKTVHPRQLHPSTFGVVCPMETPEGAGCGLVRNLALGVYTRTGYLRDVVARVLEHAPCRALVVSDDVGAAGVAVFINGCRYGVTSDATSLCAALRDARCRGVLPFDVSIANMEAGPLRQTRQVIITCDAGCLMRPVFRTDRLADAAQILRDGGEGAWLRLLRAGAVEYIDKDEETVCRIAVELGHVKTGRFTHLELHPAAMLGLCGAAIPFSDHNQAPRNTYQCAMGKQSIGVPSTDWTTRADTVSMAMPAPQRSLTSSAFDELDRGDKLPTGQNLIVAIMCYTGFNQEDSLLMNQRAVDMGLLEVLVHKTYKEELRSSNHEAHEIAAPSRLRRDGNCDAVQQTGIPEVGARLRNGDVVISKTVTTGTQANGDREIRDRSTCVKQGIGSVSTVDAVIRYVSGDGYDAVKVRTCSRRRPGVGDKLTSRHGQKGVIGAVIPDRDMPFIASGPGRGLQPDIIVNPHAIPSRMTIGHLLEGLASKVAAATGRRMDGTPFCGQSIGEVASMLEQHGMERWGNERCFNGKTGRPIEAEVMMTPVFYQRLRHMVEDKCHSRSRGPVQTLTRQPAEGRSRDGGLRVGEMERDCLFAHGAAAVVSDRMFEQSDPFVAPVCANCGSFAEHARPGGSACRADAARAYCRECDTGESVSMVSMPYATKLFLQEIAALNIEPRLVVE